MAYVKPEYRIAKIHMAAGLFVGFTRDAKVIAEKLDTTERNVLRWAKDPEWITALEAVGYEGDTSFRIIPRGRNPQRENPEVFGKAKALYLENRKTAKTGWQAAKMTADALKAEDIEVSQRTIYNWADKGNWNTPENATKPSEHKVETL